MHAISSCYGDSRHSNRNATPQLVNSSKILNSFKVYPLTSEEYEANQICLTAVLCVDSHCSYGTVFYFFVILNNLFGNVKTVKFRLLLQKPSPLIITVLSSLLYRGNMTSGNLLPSFERCVSHPSCYSDVFLWELKWTKPCQLWPTLNVCTTVLTSLTKSTFFIWGQM